MSEDFLKSLGNWRRKKRKKSLKETFEGWSVAVQDTYLMHPQMWKDLLEDQKRLNELRQQEEAGEMPGVTYVDIDHWFAYHEPRNDAELEAYKKIREAGKAFAKTVLNCTPSCADQTVAIRKIREAVMVANAAVACGGR